MTRRYQAIAALAIVLGLGSFFAFRATAPASAVAITPGTLTALPTSAAIYEAAPTDTTHVDIRSAVNAAESFAGVTDTSLDLGARPVLGLLTFGGTTTLASQYYRRFAWLVTFNFDTVQMGIPGNPKYAKHKLIVAIDARTGKFIIAFNAGPATLYSR